MPRAATGHVLERKRAHGVDHLDSAGVGAGIPASTDRGVEGALENAIATLEAKRSSFATGDA